MVPLPILAGQVLFQSTLPRGERLYPETGKIENVEISIHAPTRGATLNQVHRAWTRSISIHAPTRGATVLPQKNLPQILLFQSTLPRGERHAHQRPAGTAYNFNPRSHEGSDGLCSPIFTEYLKFQSTLPRGERPTCPVLLPDNVNFNPRSHEGSDPKGL